MPKFQVYCCFDEQKVQNMDIQFTNVLFETQPTHNGKQLAIITLNAPKSLNSVSLEMCQAIYVQLKSWQDDDNVVAVFLQGSGDKAFCAGGNIRNLYESMITTPVHNSFDKINDKNHYFSDFFQHEYHLNYFMATYPKPIIAWANGIVMGGGLGLVATCSHRIVTETTRFAMPEINIGLFPDATGSWFLAKTPAQVGLFFGLTGTNGNANDALLLNLAEFAMSTSDRQTAIEALLSADWQTAHHDNHAVASRALSQKHNTKHLPDSNVAKHWQTIQHLVNQGDIYDIDKALKNPALHEKFADDSWFIQALDTYEYGCPVTAYLTYTLFKQVKTLSLKEILQLELNVAVHCCYFADFREGVRALIVDKDKSPKWSKTLAECDKAYIDSHFDDIFINDVKLTLSS